MIDYRGLGMLIGLMVMSAAFVASGFYARVAAWVTTLRVSPPVSLAILVSVCGLLSAVLTNDVVVALGAAAILLVDRKIAPADMMKHKDGSLLLLFMGLFVVNAAMAATDMPQHLLAGLRNAGVNLNEPVTLFAVATVISNIVGNNAPVWSKLPPVA